MIDELKLFRGQTHEINDHIVVRQPTIGEICDYGEQKYYNMILDLCATPSDCKVFLLDKFGIDYEKLSEFSFFCLFSRHYGVKDTAIILGDLDLSQLSIAGNTQTKETSLQNDKGTVVIDNATYILLTNYLRTIHGFERHVDKAANEHTKRHLIDTERRRMLRHQNDKPQSMLVSLVSAMVNCEQFKYNHATVWNLPIYTFMDSVQRIQKLQNYNQVMQGAYAGTVDLKTISEDALNWMGSLSQR